MFGMLSMYAYKCHVCMYVSMYVYVCMYACMYVSRSKYMYICMHSLSCGYRIFIEPENHSYPSGEKVGCSMELRHSVVIRINSQFGSFFLN